MPGLISGVASAIVAAVASRMNYGDRLYVFYPSRIPARNSTDYISQALNVTIYRNGGMGRTAFSQVFIF